MMFICRACEMWVANVSRRGLCSCCAHERRDALILIVCAAVIGATVGTGIVVLLTN